MATPTVYCLHDLGLPGLSEVALLLHVQGSKLQHPQRLACMTGSWCWLLAGGSAGAVSGTSHSIVTGFQVQVLHADQA